MGDGGTGRWPTGTVTFLVTDIERSTSLYEELGPAFEELLERHRAICRSVFEQWRGAEVSCPGDGFLVAFASASAAVSAAVGVQGALAAHVWPDGAVLRVRIGIHTGEAALTSTGGTYVGLALHEVTRVSDAGHGGQVLLSEPTYRLVEHQLPPEVGARSLGPHQLAGLHGSRVLFELQGPGLRAGFPALRTKTQRRGNLPTPGADLLGRDEELAQLASLVQTVPLTTVVGLGGMGKTRLALEVAHAVESQFEDGAWFVDLAAAPPGYAVPELTSRVGSALDVDITGGPAALAGVLRGRRTLIVLDNCEHVLESVAVVAEAVLAAAPGVRLLATSREVLGLPVEQVVTLDALSAATSVRLFQDRASEVLAGFELAPSVRPDVERICTRLDHLPLAIELAARRMNVLAPADILARLDDRFSLLTGGRRRAPERHRTLEGTLDWKLSLLSEPERLVLTRLSVFAGGCTLEAAEAVCSGPPITPAEVLDLLSSLVDRSLLMVDRDQGGVRYRLLETVRAYAADRLAEADEVEDTRARHLTWCAGVSSAAIDALWSGAGDPDLKRLAREGANMRAAVRWAQEGGDIDQGLRTANGVAMYGFETGTDFRVSRTWVDELLAAGAGAGDVSLRVQALFGAANVSAATEDDEAMARYGEEMLSLVDRHDLSPTLRGCALMTLGHSQREDTPRRLAGLRDGADLLESDGTWGLASFAHSWISQYTLEAGDAETAHVAAEQALELGRRAGLDIAVARALTRLAHVVAVEGDLDVATARAVEAEAIARATGAGSEIGLALLAKATIAAAAGGPGAAELWIAAADQFAQMGFMTVPVRIWAALATIALSHGNVVAAEWPIARLDEAMVDPLSDPASRRALAALVSAAEEAGGEKLLVPLWDRMPTELGG